MTAGRPPRKRRPASGTRATGTPKDAPKDASGGGKGTSGSWAGRGGVRRTPRKTETRTEVSAGGVVYRREPDGVEVVLAARRTRRGDLAWGLAKGGIEVDESPQEAAVREVREETGIEAEIEASLGETRYFYVWDDVRVRKVVHFFLMRAVGGDTGDHDDEMEDVRWFPLDRALKRAAYRGEREVLARAAERLR